MRSSLTIPTGAYYTAIDIIFKTIRMQIGIITPSGNEVNIMLPLYTIFSVGDGLLGIIIIFGYRAETIFQLQYRSAALSQRYSYYNSKFGTDSFRFRPFFFVTN